MKLKSKWRKHASSVVRRFHVSLRELSELVIHPTMTNGSFLNVSQTNPIARFVKTRRSSSAIRSKKSALRSRKPFSVAFSAGLRADDHQR